MPLTTTAPPTWDLFCRVVDNFGDIGVCWRLAADLASRGHAVRLWTDDASALAWMAPEGRSGVTVSTWDEAASAEPAEVVIEAFGCDPPPSFVARMARRGTGSRPVPVWINLEYLSAEAEVERSHGLPSPQFAGPGAGLTKWFFYPGFTARTGGLIRERDLMLRQQNFDATAFLQAPGLQCLNLQRPNWQRESGERLVSLFCYDNPAVPALLSALRTQPTLLLTAPGAATRQVQYALAQWPIPGLRVAPLPYLSQLDFDHLLWTCDLNFVRGEDSFVRAQWAGKPFVWQIYPQHDGVHAEKLEAFLARFIELAEVTLQPTLRGLLRAWNGLGANAPSGDACTINMALPDQESWRSACESWRDGLCRQADLATQLTHFVAERR